MNSYVVEVTARVVVKAETIGEAVDLASLHFSIRNSTAVHRIGCARFIGWEPEPAAREHANQGDHQ